MKSDISFSILEIDQQWIGYSFWLLLVSILNLFSILDWKSGEREKNKMNNEKRNELKKVLRAVLIAEKSSGMPLRTLQRKYSEIEGKPMPLFGYPDAAALLNSLNDTVFTVCHTRHSLVLLFHIQLMAIFLSNCVMQAMVQGQLLVYPVETKETKHMSQLVQNTNERR